MTAAIVGCCHDWLLKSIITTDVTFFTKLLFVVRSFGFFSRLLLNTYLNLIIFFRMKIIVFALLRIDFLIRVFYIYIITCSTVSLLLICLCISYEIAALPSIIIILGSYGWYFTVDRTNILWLTWFLLWLFIDRLFHESSIDESFLELDKIDSLERVWLKH